VKSVLFDDIADFLVLTNNRESIHKKSVHALVFYSSNHGGGE
jgi:GTP cyclohydrolase FolE2